MKPIPYVVNERYRHKFEFNNEYRDLFEKSGFIFSGVSLDDFFVEYIEPPKAYTPFLFQHKLPQNTKIYQYTPHPIFIEFLPH